MVGGREIQGLWGADLGYKVNDYHCSLQFRLRGGWFKEQPCVIGGVVIDVYIIVVQGKTVRSRTTIIRVEDNEVDYLLHTLRLGLVLHADILPRHHPYVGHLKSMCCPSICCPAGSRGTSMVGLSHDRQ